MYRTYTVTVSSCTQRVPVCGAPTWQTPQNIKLGDCRNAFHRGVKWARGRNGHEEKRKTEALKMVVKKSAGTLGCIWARVGQGGRYWWGKGVTERYRVVTSVSSAAMSSSASAHSRHTCCLSGTSTEWGADGSLVQPPPPQLRWVFLFWAFLAQHVFSRTCVVGLSLRAINR